MPKLGCLDVHAGEEKAVSSTVLWRRLLAAVLGVRPRAGVIGLPHELKSCYRTVSYVALIDRLLA
jgi:hypothetical protein